MSYQVNGRGRSLGRGPRSHPHHGSNCRLCLQKDISTVPVITLVLCSSSQPLYTLLPPAVLNLANTNYRICRGCLNDMVSLVRMGPFLRKPLKTPYFSGDVSTLSQVKRHQQGVREVADDHDRPYETLEQHSWFDLDGDGYKEPYIIIIRKRHRMSLSYCSLFPRTAIQKNSKGAVVHIDPTHYHENTVSFLP